MGCLQAWCVEEGLLAFARMSIGLNGWAYASLGVCARSTCFTPIARTGVKQAYKQ